MPYTEFLGWTDLDRGVALARMLNQREICSQCGHPISLCRDRKTAGKWKVEHGICQASKAADVVAKKVAESKVAGVVISTRYTG